MTVAEPGRPVVVIPAWNESARLPSVLDALSRVSSGYEVVVVDDGSKDDTGALAKDRGATVLRHPFNLGYGSALQTGYKYALERKASFVVQMDADGQHDPLQIETLVQPILDGSADLVIGSRFVQPTSYRMDVLKSVGRFVFRHLSRLYGFVCTDPTSGFQVLNRRVLELYSGEFYPSDYPDIDVLLVAHRRGLRISERPVRMSEGARPSTLHSNRRTLYYIYRMTLSLWAGTGVSKKAETAQPS